MQFDRHSLVYSARFWLQSAKKYRADISMWIGCMTNAHIAIGKFRERYVKRFSNATTSDKTGKGD